MQQQNSEINLLKISFQNNYIAYESEKDIYYNNYCFYFIHLVL